MIKYPKTPRFEHVDLPGCDLFAVISEKLDGANVGVSFTPDADLQLQSRGHVLVGGRRERQFDMFKSMCAALEDRLFDVLGTRYLLFGEWLYAKHRVFYDKLPSYFMTYDVYDKECEMFLSTNRRQDLLCSLPLHEAPILHRGPFKKVHNFSQYIGESAFRSPEWKATLLADAEALGIRDPMGHTDDSRCMEGVYVKIEDHDHVVGRFKIPRPEFEKVRDSDLWDRGMLLPNRCRI